MAGYSKWSKVKHIKGPLDVKRGAAFSKLVKEITVTARIGDDGLSGNPRLRSMVETARTEHIRKHSFQESDDYDDTPNVNFNLEVPEGILARLDA